MDGVMHSTGNGDYCYELGGDTLTIYLLNKRFFTFDLIGQWLREIADWYELATVEQIRHIHIQD